MIAHELLTTLLTTHYALHPQTIELIGPPQPERLVYHVTTVAEQHWLLRLGRAAAPLPPWISAPSMASWMHQQAALLDWCARHAYAAPQVRPTQQGSLISTHADWHGLVLAFIPGTRPPATPAARRQIAAMLSQLHHVGHTTSAIERMQLPRSWWAPLDTAITQAQQLFAANTAIPAIWEPLVDTCLSILQQCRPLCDLPETIIHADCWLGNTILYAPEQVRLIDWEHAGRGVALLDLGSLLSDCFDYHETAAVIDEASIAAAMSSYQELSPLSADEREALREAIQFGSAFLAAIRCSLGCQAGWNEDISRGLHRDQACLAVSEQIAWYAHHCLVS